MIQVFAQYVPNFGQSRTCKNSVKMDQQSEREASAARRNLRRQLEEEEEAAFAAMSIEDRMRVLRALRDNVNEAGQEGGVPPMTPTDIEVPLLSHDAPYLSLHSHWTSQALETKVVSEENSSNCPVCLDPFQIGDQV